MWEEYPLSVPEIVGDRRRKTEDRNRLQFTHFMEHNMYFTPAFSTFRISQDFMKNTKM
jgi:hypothetical protein